MCLYLQDQNGESAPSLWLSSNEDITQESFEEMKRKIEDINEELISASLEEATCLDHQGGSVVSCEACMKMKEYVSTFQFHRCTQSCRKKKKVIHIFASQGLGKNENDSCDIISPVCRYKFPKFPIHKTTLLLPISKSENPKDVEQMKKDLKHIVAYLIRRAHYMNSKEYEQIWIRFKNMSFEEYLYDLGMYDSLPSGMKQEEKKEKALKRYLNALRASLSGSGYVFLKRNTEDIFINNFNTLIMTIVKCNHDLQYIFNEFSCTNYITAYVTKNEAGWSVFLKWLEEQIKNLPQMEKIKVLGSAIDKKREVSIQVAIYRVLGLAMSKFSTRVKFISTNQPHMRDGLVKGNPNSLEENEPAFHLSPHQYYELRPDELEDLCLADFVANYDYGQRETSAAIPLVNNDGYVYPRGKPAILRYYMNYDDPEDLARGLLLLFYPFRDEIADIHDRNVMDLLDENKDMVDEKRQIYEKNINLVSLIQEIEKLNDERNADENEEDTEDNEVRGEENIELETTSEKDIDDFIKSMKSAAQKDVRNNSDVTIPTINELREKIILLNKNQRLIFDDLAERIFAQNENADQFCVYIAGAAGTGPFTFTSLNINMLTSSTQHILATDQVCRI